MRRPNLLIIGAAKAASSSLTTLLDTHPGAAVLRREPQFFADDAVFARGADWYGSLFAEAAASGAAVVGENSNRYTMRELFPETVPRMRSHFGDEPPRVIYVVRHPLRRIESAWVQKRANGGSAVHHHFPTAVRRDRAWLVDPSRYLHQLEPYRAWLGDDRILVLFTEDLAAHPHTEARRCWDFLGLDHVDPGDHHANPSMGKRVERAGLDRLRRLPGWSTVVQLVPDGPRRQVRDRWFRRTVDGRPEWSDEALAWATAQVADDARALADHLGRVPGSWADVVDDRAAA